MIIRKNTPFGFDDQTGGETYFNCFEIIKCNNGFNDYEMTIRQAGINTAEIVITKKDLMRLKKFIDKQFLTEEAK